MLRRASTLVLPLLSALAFFGAWLIGLLGKPVQGDISGLQMLSALLGFFIFVGSLIGIVYLIGQRKRSMSQDVLAVWEVQRRKGKRHYIRGAVIMGFILGLLSSSLVIAYTAGEEGFGSQISTFIIFVLLVTFACYYAAVRTWNINESDYRAISEQQSRSRSLK